MPVVTNISTYKFAVLTDLKPLRERLQALCLELKLKGTILLSTEGINMFLAGSRAQIDQLVDEVRTIPGLEDLAPKYSESDDQPFTRMLVKIKKEIISFGVEGIDPARKTSPKLPARELKKWLDEGRPVTLLDTRNDFEVHLGTFKNALPIGIDHFRDFPAAVQKLPTDMKKQPIVMFCTGGIRCEKAGPYMEREGFEQIYQLDGGILKYFEECGGDHYDGECFVFDKRVGLEATLEGSGKTLCYVCQSPLTPEEQQDKRYVEGKSCPYCFKSTDELRALELAKHQAAIQRVTTPLPGSVAYENIRPLRVPRDCDGQTLLQFLGTILQHTSTAEWQQQCDAGLVLNSEHAPANGDDIVRAGGLFFHRQPGTLEPDVNADIRILYEDEAIIVLNKPAPLPIHPSGRYNRNTLQLILRDVYAPQRPRPAHRLDANTTGVVVVTRTAHFAKYVQPQFERGQVEKQYLALVHGFPSEDVFNCTAPISDTAGEVGSRAVDEVNGLPAHTEFRVLRRYENGTTLLEVRPLTGRTNQIRVHLWHLGFPICGDQTYRENHTLGDTQTHAVSDPPLCLHAHHITFTHPVSQKRVTFEAPAPVWARMSE